MVESGIPVKNGLSEEEKCHLLKQVFSSNGISKVLGRLPYLLNHDIIDPILDRLCQQESGLCPEPHLVTPADECHQKSFRGTVAEITCESYLESVLSQQSGRHVLISNQRLIEAISQLADKPPFSDVTVSPFTFNFFTSKRGYSCPDGLIGTVIDNRSAFFHTACEFKATIHSKSYHKAASQLNEAGQIFRDQQARKIIRQAISELIDIPAQHITLPPSKDPPAKLVAVDKTTRNNKELMVNHTLPPHRCEVIGLNCLQLTSQVIKIIGGQITQREAIKAMGLLPENYA